MRIFKVSQEEDDDLKDILKEYFRKWQPYSSKWRWGQLERSNDGLAKLTADELHLSEFKIILNSWCHANGLYPPLVEEFGDFLIIEWTTTFDRFMVVFNKSLKNPKSSWWVGPESEWEHYVVGDRVILKEEAQYGAGPNDEWRNTLKNLAGKEGVVTKVFPDSDHINVDFNGHLLGLDRKNIIRA